MTDSPDFESPPLQEVVCGVRFALKPLSIENILDLRSKFEDDYPEIQIAAPLPSPNTTRDVVLTLSTGSEMPRFWFISKNGDQLVQVQGDLFYVNWRKRKPSRYPRFKTIFEEFQRSYHLFEAYCEEKGLGPIVLEACELSYVNFMSKGVEWNELPEIGKILTNLDFDHSGRKYLNNLSNFVASFNYALPEDKGLLTTKYSIVKKVEDETQSLRLQLTAQGLGEEKSWDSAMEWFRTAHDHIVFGFCELTEPEAQVEYWGFKEAKE